MKKAFIVIVILSTAFAQQVYADDASRRKMVEDLFSMMDVQKNMEKTYDTIRQMLTSQLDRVDIPEENREAVRTMQERITDLVTEEFSWDNLKDEYIDIYTDMFTDEEIKQLLEFYKTPVGQKLVEKTPELMEKMMNITQRKMADILPRMQQIIQESVEEHKKSVAPPAEEEQQPGE